MTIGFHEKRPVKSTKSTERHMILFARFHIHIGVDQDREEQRDTTDDPENNRLVLRRIDSLWIEFRKKSISLILGRESIYICIIIASEFFDIFLLIGNDHFLAIMDLVSSPSESIISERDRSSSEGPYTDDCQISMGSQRRKWCRTRITTITDQDDMEWTISLRIEGEYE